MFFNNNQESLEGLKFRPDEELEDEPKMNQEKISAKDIWAIILAQYSILIPIALISSVIFGVVLFLITRLMR
ncbi:Uncharacterised protein [Clostridium putrefaciens]|uniref:Uncharacterized protein n=1 Tax=Clostridium putrefaciens TaxID=99675 RepID=A0A381JAB7_9CLOT|nr:hypothetical protein [Clostridium putrefaciens]SUY47929.1 Uncharacterised protein [Clostridium putrefaciens]